MINYIILWSDNSNWVAIKSPIFDILNMTQKLVPEKL